MFALKQRGDTIVEVLIAMAVAASVLGLTYSTMNRNLLITRDAQERTEATKLAQGQLEALRVAINNGTVITNNKAFCMNGVTPTYTGFPLGWLPDTNLAADNFASYAPVANCPRSPNQLFYNYVIVGNAGTYHVYVRWDRVDKSSRDQVIYAYRQT